MGVVYVAREVHLDRPVAIKLLPPELATSPVHRARFVREARTAAALSHPHIVPIHAVEEHADLVFFVMTFVDGETLAERVRRTGPLPTRECVRVVQETAWALAHAHANGVVHRDVKPDNILLERGSGRVVVTDFGIARLSGAPQASGESEIVGTPSYMSPEQASGDRIDGRSDLYSLGAVAFFAAAGRPPFDGTSAVAILAKHAIEPAARLGSLRPALPPSFSAAVDRCLAKDPAMRWESAESLAIQLGSSAGSARDIAPAVQAFVRESESAGSEIALGVTAAATSVAMLGIAALRAGHGFGTSLFSVIDLVLYLGIASSMLGLATFRFGQLIGRARALLRRGYGHSAVRPVPLSGEAVDDRDEEVAGTLGAAGVLLRVAATAGAIWLTGADATPIALAGAAASIVVPTLTVRRLWNESSRTARWWASRIRGSLGAAIFRLAGLGVDRGANALPAAGEPTAVALRGAVSELFGALSPEQRAAFPRLPALVNRLERIAVGQRREPGMQPSEHTQTAVVALELLRLELLRLHAAPGSTGDLTREIEAASRIGDEIDARSMERDGAAAAARRAATISE
jgi:serine/threonine-protein kinase